MFPAGDNERGPFEVAGNANLLRAALSSLDRGGVCTLVGMLGPGEDFMFPWEALRRERRLQTSHLGPIEAIAVYLDMYARGIVRDISPMVKTWPLREWTVAITESRLGRTGRAVLVMP